MTPDKAGERLHTHSIRLDNLTGPPSVTGVEVTSDAGDAATYGRGDTIRVRLTSTRR